MSYWVLCLIYFAHFYHHAQILFSKSYYGGEQKVKPDAWALDSSRALSYVAVQVGIME